MIDAALQSIDLSAIAAMLLEQEAKGHTAESDAARPLDCMARKLVELSQCARDVALEGERQNLDVAYRRTAVVGALAVALMRRIRLEQSRKEGSTNDERQD